MTLVVLFSVQIQSLGIILTRGEGQIHRHFMSSQERTQVGREHTHTHTGQEEMLGERELKVGEQAHVPTFKELKQVTSPLLSMSDGSQAPCEVSLEQFQ